jgi:hypothetical protein
VAGEPDEPDLERMTAEELAAFVDRALAEALIDGSILELAIGAFTKEGRGGHWGKS